MRTGHCFICKYLYKIGVADDHSYERGQLGDQNHTLIQCSVNAFNSFDLYVKLTMFVIQNLLSARIVLVNTM